MGYFFDSKPRFEWLPKPIQNNERYYEYMEIMINSFISGFKWNLPEEIEIYPFVCQLLREGCIGIAEGKFYGTLRHKGSGIDQNGALPIDGINCANGKQYNGKIVPFYFLKSRNPNMTFSRFAEQLASVDLSQKVLVKATRYGNIVACDTNEEMEAMKQVFKDIDDGNLRTMVRSNIGWTKQSENDKKLIQITDPMKFQSMEFLSSYHSELCRRLYSLYGFSMQGKDKQAQVTTEELDDRELPTLLYICEILNNMQECCKNINAEFGTNWSIEPSRILAKQIKDALTDDEKEEQKETEGGADNETEGTDEQV